jgi:hypothetical protein
LSAVAVQEQAGHLLEAQALRELVNVVSLGLQAGIEMDPADGRFASDHDLGSFRNITC